MKGRKERILFGEKNHINALSRSSISIENLKTQIHICSVEFLKDEKKLKLISTLIGKEKWRKERVRETYL